MNEMIMLHEVKSLQALRIAIDKKLPAVMSYLDNGQWHLSRIMLTALKEGSLKIKATPKKKTHGIKIQVGQTVGISLKYGYGDGYDKFVFDTTVLALILDETMMLAIPHEIEQVKKRSY